MCGLKLHDHYEPQMIWNMLTSLFVDYKQNGNYKVDHLLELHTGTRKMFIQPHLRNSSTYIVN